MVLCGLHIRPIRSGLVDLTQLVPEHLSPVDDPDERRLRIGPFESTAVAWTSSAAEVGSEEEPTSASAGGSQAPRPPPLPRAPL